MLTDFTERLMNDANIILYENWGEYLANRSFLEFREDKELIDAVHNYCDDDAPVMTWMDDES